MKNLNYFLIVAVIVILSFMVLRNDGFTYAVNIFPPLLSEKPKCSCYFPNEKKYGIKVENGGCKVTNCIPPEKVPNPSPPEMQCAKDVDKNEEK